MEQNGPRLVSTNAQPVLNEPDWMHIEVQERHLIESLKTHDKLGWEIHTVVERNSAFYGKTFWILMRRKEVETSSPRGVFA